MSQDNKPATHLDLDQQIDRLERQLVAREAWIRDAASALTQRAQVAATPQPWLLPVLGAGVVLWLGWRWWHRAEPARPVVQALPAAPEAQHPVSGGLVDLPWAGLTALAWPLVPLAWRTRISPAAAAAGVSTLLSVARRLLRRRR